MHVFLLKVAMIERLLLLLQLFIKNEFIILIIKIFRKIKIKLFIFKNLKSCDFHFLTRLLKFLDALIQVEFFHKMNDIDFSEIHFILIFIIQKHLTQEFIFIRLFNLTFGHFILSRCEIVPIYLQIFIYLLIFDLLIVIFAFLINEFILHYIIIFIFLIVIVKLIKIWREVDILDVNILIITIRLTLKLILLIQLILHLG